MKSINKLFLLTLLISLFSCNYKAQQKDDFSKRIDSLLNAKNPRPFNGVILISKNGKTKYSNVVGYKNFDTKEALNLNSQFEIMSNTKQITAVLILKEVEKGNINLQDPIKKYLPTLMQPWADSVTIHQLLNHTHGIVDINKSLLFKPGTDFKYGNLSNSLLGKIIEGINHKSYSEVAAELFKSLGMKNTFCYSKTDKRNLVSGYMNKDNIFTLVENSQINADNMAADSVVATAGDLVIWNNVLHKGKLLKPNSYQLMTTESAKSQHDVFGKEKMGYGYNIRIVNEYGIQYLGHTGLGDGFASLNIYIPKSDVSLVILENQMNENSDLYYYYETLIKNIVLQSKALNN